MRTRARTSFSDWIFFKWEKSAQTHFGMKKNIQKNVEKYGDNEKKCEMTREVS